MEDFLWGFLDLNTRTTSGRPVHAITGSDGAVYVSDDATGNIYKVAYTGPRINPGGFVQRATGIYEMYGQNLANDTRNFGIYADGVRLDTLYISAGQVNFVLPATFSGDATITVANEKGSDEAMLHISQYRKPLGLRFRGAGASVAAYATLTWASTYLRTPCDPNLKA